MLPMASSAINNDGLDTAVKLLILVLVVVWLALVYYTYADARRRIADPMLVALRDRRVALPVRRDGRLHDRAPARVPRGRARARARDAGRRGAPALAELLPVPALRHRGRARLPALPQLHAQAQGPVRELRASRWTRPGASARTARPRSRASRPRRAVEGAAGARAPTRSSSSPRRRRPSKRHLNKNPRRALPMDRTLILVKPDAFARGLTGEIIARFERKGLRIAALKHMQLTERDRRAPLRRARGQAVLRRARRVHHLRPARRHGPRGPRGRGRRAPGHRRHQPARGRPGLDPRRLRPGDRPEHGPRLGLRRVGRARGGPLLRRDL